MRGCCISAAVILAFAANGAAGAEGPEAKEILGAGMRLGFESRGSLAADFQFDLPGVGLALDFEAKAQGLLVKAGLESPGLVLGPARARGAAAFLASPTSQSALALASEAFALDRGLSSTLSVLALGSGDLWAYAAGRGGSPGFLASLPGLPQGLEGSGEAEAWGQALLPRLSSMGVIGCLGGPASLWALACGASRSAPEAAEEGWRLDAPREAGGSALEFGLATQSRGQTWRSALGLGLAWAESSGRGLALRLEGEALLDALRLSLRAGAASPSYRGPFGEAAGSGASLALDARLSLWPGASLGLALRASHPSLGSPPWDGGPRAFPERSCRASFAAPLGGQAFLRASLGFGLKAEGEAFIEPVLALSFKAEASSLSLSVTATGLERAEGPKPPLACHVSLDAGAAAFRGMSATLSLDLEAEAQGGKAPSLESALRLRLPLDSPAGAGMAASLGLELAWKAGSLVVLPQVGACPPISLGLSWSSSFHYHAQTFPR